MEFLILISFCATFGYFVYYLSFGLCPPPTQGLICGFLIVIDISLAADCSGAYSVYSAYSGTDLGLEAFAGKPMVEGALLRLET